MKRILSFGEIIWDVFPDKKAIGGAPLNFAAHAALGGAKSSLFSAVGEDALGRDALEALAGFGVGTEFVKTVKDRPTGQCIVTLDAHGLPRYNVLAGVAYDFISFDDSDAALVREGKFDALYFGTLIQRAPASREALRKLTQGCAFPTVFCDVNLRPNCYDEASVRFCLENATVLKVSAEEEPALRKAGGYCPQDEDPEAITRTLAKRYRNLDVVILTRGGDGSFALDARSGEACAQEAIGDKVVSTVGAGDSFSAAFLTCFLNGQPLKECMKRAAEISGQVVGRLEAVPEDIYR